MRYFIFVLSVLAIACGTEPHSNPLRDNKTHDSITGVITQAEEWEKFDSTLPGKMELWRKEGVGNYYAIQLRYTKDDGQHRVVLTDTFPSYMYYHRKHDPEFAELNGGGEEETIIRFGGSWGMGSEPGVGREENLDFFFVVDLENSKVLWQGCYLHHYEQTVEKNIPDSLFGPFKVGYDYKVHVKNNEIVIDSLNNFGDSADAPDHAQGRYEWHDDAFVLMPKGE